jgi:hypothetical protein
MAEVENTPCPACGARTLRLVKRLCAHPVCDFSLAGQGMKFSAHWGLVLVCDTCGIEAVGVRD